MWYEYSGFLQLPFSIRKAKRKKCLENEALFSSCQCGERKLNIQKCHRGYCLAWIMWFLHCGDCFWSKIAKFCIPTLPEELLCTQTARVCVLVSTGWEWCAAAGVSNQGKKIGKTKDSPPSFFFCLCFSSVTLPHLVQVWLNVKACLCEYVWNSFCSGHFMGKPLSLHF